MSKKQLGDSVYAEIENSILVIYTDNGLGKKNVIILEPEVQDSLIEFIAQQENQ